MALQTIPVIPFKTGLERDKEPFLLENDAFPQLENCYLYQGKVSRRIGNSLLGRMVQRLVGGALGNTGASPFVLPTIFTVLPAIGTLGIQPGSVTVNIAAPIGPLVYVDDGIGGLSAGGANIGTIDYVTGALSIAHPAGAASAVTVTLSYYTGRPVMGLRSRELVSINVEDLFAFDTVKANRWDNATRRFYDISQTTGGLETRWNGTDSDFFWTCNYYRETPLYNKLFWATNNVQSTNVAGVIQDGIQIYNGTGWAAQNPLLTTAALANSFLNGCLMLVPYRGRMVALNTWESTAAIGGGVAIRYPNRARWSQNGVPYTDILGGADATAWDSVTPGKGGYEDAPTAEHIVACGFFKDTLIVYFERSTWALVYTGSTVYTFIWQRINMNFGCEGTFSTVEFDKGVFSVGDKAITIADSVNVERIDQKIPFEVFNIHNLNQGPQRVYGIRDYSYQFVYWTFPNSLQNGIYPNRVLVLNYLEGSYSFYTDSYTCFGYHQSMSDKTWAECKFSWASAVWSWMSGRRQAHFPSVVAGNQVGFVVVMDQKVNNDSTLYVTAITQAIQCVVACPSHNLVVGQYVVFHDVQGMTAINSMVGKILSAPGVNTFVLDIDTSGFAAYTIGGTIEVLNNIDVTTKKYNPFFTQGQKARLNYIDLFVDKTSDGQFDVEAYVDDSYSLPVQTKTVVTTQNYGPTVPVQKVFQRVYFDLIGQFFQFRVTLSDLQMRTLVIRESDLVIHALNIYLQTSGRLV